MIINNTVLWNTVPWSLAKFAQFFVQTCCIHLEGRLLFYHKDWGSKLLLNERQYLLDYTATRPRKTALCSQIIADTCYGLNQSGIICNTSIGFEVLTVVIVHNIVVFSVVTPCGMEWEYRLAVPHESDCLPLQPVYTLLHPHPAQFDSNNADSFFVR
jgi:hypothetical protein